MPKGSDYREHDTFSGVTMGVSVKRKETVPFFLLDQILKEAADFFFVQAGIQVPGSDVGGIPNRNISQHTQPASCQGITDFDGNCGVGVAMK